MEVIIPESLLRRNFVMANKKKTTPVVTKKDSTTDIPVVAATLAKADEKPVAKKEVKVNVEPKKEVKVEKAAEVKPEAKKEEKAPAKAPAKKPAAKKATTTTTAKKTTSTKATKVENNIYVQFSGKEFDTAVIEKAVKADYTAKNGKKDMKSVSIYIKPEDMKAYYVIDGIIGDVAL